MTNDQLGSFVFLLSRRRLVPGLEALLCPGDVYPNANNDLNHHDGCQAGIRGPWPTIFMRNFERCQLFRSAWLGAYAKEDYI